MLLPVALGLLGLGVQMTIGQGFEIPQIFDASQLPAQFENFPRVGVATRPQPDLSDPSVVETLEQQWLEATKRVSKEALNRCPVSCSSAGSDSVRWDLYPNVARMGVCNETVMFETAVFSGIDTDLTPAPLRVCTADLVKRAPAPERSPGSDKTCAPVFEVETSLMLRLALTGAQPGSGQATAEVVSAIDQISNRVNGIPPSCNNNTIAFAHAGNSVVGLYVGSQAHRQGIAADVLDLVLARVKSKGVSETLVAELCEPDAGYGADYVVGIVVSATGDLRTVQQNVRRWGKASCLTADDSSQTLGEQAVALLVPAPAVLANGNTPSESSTGVSFSNGTNKSTARGVRDSGAMFHGLARRVDYCTNVKLVVAGNTCETIADKRCAISLSTFLSYNPGIDCKNLWVNQKVCCTPGAVPPPDPVVPKPDPYCTNWKTVQAGHSCSYMADKRCTISLSAFTSQNPQLNCNKLRVGQTFCCNAGRVPPENECSNSKTVVADNTCLQIADKRCTISIDTFIEYNPQLDCSTLQIGERFCCDYGRVPPPGPPPNADGTCKTGVVAAEEGCVALSSKCGIVGDYITQFNAKSDFCSSLMEGQVFCCGRGNLPDLRPKKNADGSCFAYTIQATDTCNKTAIRNQLTQADLFKFNKKTWGWNGCVDLWVGSKICLSEGTPPMPATISDAVCGPTVPGTQQPANGTSLADLNPCPLNVCCNHWGKCGMTKDFCDITKSETGAPGTTTCVSSCGTEIILSPPAASQMRIAYFSAWNANRPCLNMNVDQIPTGWYTHIHFAFAAVTASFDVDISAVQDEWDRFMAMKGVKKVISFGGWDFSVLPGTFKILRDAVKPENCETFRRNVVNFVNKYNLDGVDLDWEYPGAPDMPIIPAGDPVEGLHYSIWLRSIRDSLPSSKSVSFAAPASFWYLKAFPISTMASYIDYVVYMTYDLHGQWDIGNAWSIDGCKSGDCLRSHVNITETMSALSMITKAGMPSNKVVVGVTSYGRSFQMAQLDCVDSMCRFTGDNKESRAEPGRCTGTKGYISNAEIDEIISTNPTAKKWEKDMTNYLVYNQYEWVSYMSGENKRRREDLYMGLHMRGSTDWAVDLQSFEYSFYFGQDPVDPSELEELEELARPCDDRSFATLEELDGAGMPAHCMDGYVLEVLARMLEDGLNAYDAIMKTDYDRKFGYFAKAVKETWKSMLERFYYDDKTDNDKWYLCTQVGNNKQLPCPPKGNQGSSIRMGLKDEQAFGNHIMSEFGISFEDTEAGVIPRNLAGCLPIYNGNPLDPTSCVLPYPASSTVEGLRVIRKDLVVPNPKDAIGEALGNLRSLPSYLRQIAIWERLEVLGSDLSASDVIETSGPGIFMVLDSVDAMKKAYDIGEDAEEEEKKRKRENIIMWVLSAILFILPGAGQALGSFTRIAMIGRIASITAYTGGAAMSAYEIAADPDNLVLGIFFLLVDLIPGVGSFTRGTWRDGAILRSRVTPAQIEKMGPIVKKGLTKLDEVRRICRR